MPSHAPQWHLLDDSFPQADAGLAVRTRTLSSGEAELRIQNLDHSDPPGYQPGSVPRGAFNRNVFNVTPSGCMPAIPVNCSISGFDPQTHPIQWRLICRHVLCRHYNAGHYQYKSGYDVFDREWRGEGRAATFIMFGSDSPECSCTYSDGSHVMGGHAILQVAVTIGGTVLTDFVHLRIGGSNPTQDDVLDYLKRELADSDPNVACMIRAVFAHESGYRQFASGVQSQAVMTFSYKRGFHQDPAQPDCAVTFMWPADPPNFPLVTFDYGVGVSQYTRVSGQSISSDMAWDWRENIRSGINLFLTNKLRRTFKVGMNWQAWGLAAWAAYNGSGAAAQQYAKALAASSDGLKLSDQLVPAQFEIAALRSPAALPDPGPWIPESSSAASA